MPAPSLPAVEIRVNGGDGIDLVDLRPLLLNGQVLTRAGLAGLVFLTDPADGSLVVYAPGDADFPVLGLLDVELLQVAQAGGSGTETVEVSSRVALALPVVAGAGPVYGSYLANTASGTAGNDVIFGHGGADLLAGNAGNDTLYGGDGADTLNGGTGDDFLFGGTSAQDVRDVIYGGDGNDSVDGGYGNDDLFGGNGRDTLVGGFGADTLAGNAGADVLAGGAGSDMLYGNDGADVLNGGFGYDRLNGGAGADRFFHQGVADHGSDWVQDYSATQGDALVVGLTGAQRTQFQVNVATTPGAGSAAVPEAFVIYRPTGQILWALVDGGDDSAIWLDIGGRLYNLLA